MKATRLTFCLMLLSTPAMANDFSDPDWPCIQRKAANLSAGIMWPHPVEDGELDQDARDLVAILSLRRVDLEEAEKRVEAFVQARPETDARLLGRIFIGVFDNLSGLRNRLIDGIANYAQSQASLSVKIDEARGEMETQLSAEQPDYDRMDRLEETIDWNERIYKDRQRSLTYVCETPVLLEKRLYAVAQILMKFMPQ
ncbi:hypothetical protein [Notoacmeibacter sp. MSK16QG-6]|uniref:hypothetical protein n=1 Tax=Notoacmeibacter sp. MSK16QG-6 TaxID=2957982 RepID=UPI00209E5C77|nr:hypothetical protein [Notoacmeibacter sp. MSK16QG-6]MCP1200643.1 hypothetical protein [Notoacmeibacter sp. MSK16QG-6]